MLNKLIKVDLRFTLKAVPIFFGVGAVCALISFISGKINSTSAVEFIHIFSKNTALSLAIGGFINILMRSFVNFRQKLYSDESYLTHTLPVSKKTIYYSKFLSSVYSLLLGGLLALVIFIFNYNLFENFDLIKTFLEFNVEAIGLNSIEFMVLLILAFFLEMLLLISIVFLGIIAKNYFKKHAVLSTTLAVGGSYLLIQGSVFLAIFLVGLFNPEVMEIFTSTKISGAVIRTILYLGVIVYSFGALALTVANIKLLEKGVNVD